MIQDQSINEKLKATQEQHGARLHLKSGRKKKWKMAARSISSFSPPAGHSVMSKSQTGCMLMSSPFSLLLRPPHCSETRSLQPASARALPLAKTEQDTAGSLPTQPNTFRSRDSPRHLRISVLGFNAFVSWNEVDQRIGLPDLY